MNTHKRIEEITESLRDIYKNDNDGPRLIAEMVEREFPESLKRITHESELDDLKVEIKKLETTIREVKAGMEGLIASLENTLAEA